MNKTEAINWKAFKAKLLQHPNLHLQFRYAQGKLVDAAYHITEIKQAVVTSVDCGGVLNRWKEIIVQLWVPENEQQPHPMKVIKALSIVNTVENMLTLDPDATVKIEFGNSDFDTRQMYPAEITIDDTSFTVDLQPDAVQCKAQTRGGSCGTDDKGDECCVPMADKPKLQLINLAAPADACCTPGGGCC